MDPRLDPAPIDRIPPSRRGHVRPRVLDVTASVGDAGDVIRAAEGLRDHGFDVRLVSGGDGLTDEIEAPGIAHTFLPWLDRDLGLGDDLRALGAIAGIVRRWRPDVIHTRLPKAGALGRTVAIRGRVPIILHTFDHVGASDGSGPRHGAVIERRLASRTDALIACSPERRDDLLAGGIGLPTQWHVMPPDGEPTALAELVGRLLERAAASRIRSAPSPVHGGRDVAAVAAVGGRG